jgi:hypothetical protein
MILKGPAYGKEKEGRQERDWAKKEGREKRDRAKKEEEIAMRLSEYLEDFYTFSGKASDVARTAAFAGLGLIWVFKIDAKPVPKLPDDLLIPAGLFALGLALDLLHYVTASIIWGLFYLWHERTLANPNDDPELTHPSLLVYPIRLLFGLKLVSIMAGYLFVGKFIVNAW